MVRTTTVGTSRWKSRNERNTRLPFITNIPRIDKHKIHNGIRGQRIPTIFPSLGPSDGSFRSSPPLTALFSPWSALFFLSQRDITYHETAVRVYASSRPRIISNGRYYRSYDWSRDRCFLEFKLIRVQPYVLSFVLFFSRKKGIRWTLRFEYYYCCAIRFFFFKSLHMNAQWKFGGMIIFGIDSLLLVLRIIF